jgi:N-methylhydantoinase A
VPGDGSAACYAEREIFFDDRFLPSRLYHREQLSPGDAMDGPAMITEYTSATILPPCSRASVDGFANLLIAVGAGA